MKKLLGIFIMLVLAPIAHAQATNPQNTFSNAVNVNSPSLWLNFNDATTAFKDSVSQSSFGPYVRNGAIITPTSALSSGYVVLNPIALPAGIMNSFSIQFYTAPTAGAYTFVVASGAAATSLTIAQSFTVNVAATTAVQTFTAPANFTAVSVTAGEYFGYWASSSTTAVGFATTGGPGFYYLAAASSLPTGAQSYAALAGPDNLDLVPAVTVASAGTPRQPGFDNTNNANYSTEFAYNQFNAAPNNALGGIDWNSPWTMLLHVDRFNWDHTGTVVLASKGDTNTAGVNNNWWKVFVQPNSYGVGASELCFARNGLAPDTVVGTGGAFVVSQEFCTQSVDDAMPNGLNYDIVLEDSGTGTGSALSLYLNGLRMPLTLMGGTTTGFGGVSVGVTSGGTGYASTTAYTSTGGGTNCVVQGTAYATGGVISSAYSSSGNTNAGCMSTPTIVLTAPTGTGAVLTAASYPMTMNSSSRPLMVPGYESNGTYYGADGADSSQNPVYVDEFALFPGNLTFGQVTNLFYTTKFYQNLLYAYSTPPVVVLDSCCCGPDFSGDQTMAMTIGAAKAGLIKLAGLVDNDGNPNGQNSVGWWRQMLDEAGLNDVGISVGPGSPTANTGGCPAANLTAYNASTPQNASAYESSVTMYRTIFAQYPTTPVYALVTQGANGYAAFVTSPADGISPLTGLQLQARNAANGGYVNMFQGNLGLTPTALQTVLNDNGSLPIYMFGGSPAQGGPGILVSRTANDPLYMAATEMSIGDAVSGWTNMNLAQVLSPYFYGGVTVTYSGGTGYANATPFTSTGGGTSCHVTGIMTASGGVPNGIETSWGESFPATSTYNGLGYGCMSAPTIVLTAPSGTGVTLTSSTTLIPTCYGTAGCSGEYVVWPSQWAQAPAGLGTAPVFTWFQNSLMDPPVNGAPRTY
jgi:hypothetical protein